VARLEHSPPIDRLQQPEDESAAKRVQQRDIYNRQSALTAYKSELLSIDARSGGGTAGALSSYI